MKKIIAMTLALIMCLSLVSVVASAETSTDYYLAGYINGADYGIEGDAANLGDYKFENGKVAVTFSSDSYVLVKNGDNTCYMTNGWLGTDATSATLADSSTLGADANKLFVPAGTVTFTLTENTDGTLTLSYVEGSEPEPTEPTTSTTEPTTPEEEENTGTNEKYTLTVEVPASWTTVNLYTWTDEPGVEAFGTYPGSAMTKESGNTYQCEIDGKLKYLVLSNQDSTKTADLTVRSGCDVNIVVSSDYRASITYPNAEKPGRHPLPDIIEGELSNYRVVGNTDWLGNWDPAFEGGRMTKMADGTYRVKFKDVPPGSYAIKITKDGKWGGDIGDNGNNYCFTVDQKSTITVDLTFKGGEGIIDVYGNLAGWIDEEEDENPKSSDLSMVFPAALLLVCAPTLPLVLRKRK